MQNWQEKDELLLLKAAKDGDHDAFGTLYGRYVTPVYRFLYAHLGNCMDAEDLTGEVFMRAWRSMGSYRQQGLPFSAFLFRIARNAVVDHYRKNRHNGSTDLEDLSYLPDKGNDPGTQAQLNLENAELRARLGQLREDYQSVLIARFISGLSPEETAAAMGKTTGAVRVLQHRALAALRKLLE